jgi:mercuric ion binding protein
MKPILLLLSLTLFATTAFSQAKKVVINATIQTPGVQCEDCKKRIEDDLKRIDGIQKVLVDFRNKRTKVSFFSDRTNIENIKTAIANIGYDADDVTANPESYARLPKKCKEHKK